VEGKKLQIGAREIFTAVRTEVRYFDHVDVKIKLVVFGDAQMCTRFLEEYAAFRIQI
jgi:hypothetical protein